MESEKVKEIKEKLKKQYYYLDRAYSDHLAYGGKADEQQEEEIYFLGDILTLINELESENERLNKALVENLEAYKDGFNEGAGLKKGVDDKLKTENQQLKDRIAELEKEKCRNEDLHIATEKLNDTIILKQFAERLKEKLKEKVNADNVDVFVECAKLSNETLNEFVNKGEKL